MYPWARIKKKIMEHHALYTHQSTQAVDFPFYPFLDADLKEITLLLAKVIVTLAAFKILSLCVNNTNGGHRQIQLIYSVFILFTTIEMLMSSFMLSITLLGVLTHF